MNANMTALAIRNLRAFLSKAPFATDTDREAALICVDVLEEAAALATPAACGVPAGYALVPIELDYSDNGIRSVLVNRFTRAIGGENFLYGDVWRDLLAAAPPVAQPSQKETP